MKELLKRFINNDYVRRVFHTFWQAAGGMLIAGLLAAHSTQDVKFALGAALAAGLAAIKAMLVSKTA